MLGAPGGPGWLGGALGPGDITGGPMGEGA